MDRLLLAALAGCLLLWLGYRGAYQPVAFDESWHLFFGHVSPLSKALREWAKDTHPPMCSILLRTIVPWTADPFWPRLLFSILPAVVQPVLWFCILRRLGVSRPLCHASALLFTASHAFTDLAVVVRGYSLASACVMAAVLGLLSAFPGGSPRRSGIAMGLVFAGVAVNAEYPAALCLGALFAGVLAVGMLDRSFLSTTLSNLREHSRAPERWVAAIAVLGVVAFYLVTRGSVDFTNAPQWRPSAGQGTVDYLVRGVVNNLYYFTPIDLRNSSAAVPIVGIGMGLLVAFGVYLARRGDDASRLRAVVLWGLVFLTVGIGTLGLLHKYPWGGEVRHQFLFAPFFHVIPILAADAILRAVGNRGLVWGTATILVVVGARITFVSRAEFDTNEVQYFELWSAERAAVFADDSPVIMPTCAMMGMYGVHRPWMEPQFEEELGEWDRYTGGAPRRDIFRPRYRWTIAPGLESEFLEELARICDQRNYDAVRVFTARFDGSTVQERIEMTEAATALARKHGFTLDERRVWSEGETMRLRRSQ